MGLTGSRLAIIQGLEFSNKLGSYADRLTELPDERTPITVMSAYIAKPPFCQQLANNNVTNKLAWINERSRLRHARCR